MRDRFDLSVDVHAVPWTELNDLAASESTAVVRARVVRARDAQRARQGTLNGRVEGAALRDVCRLHDATAERAMHKGAERLGLSARAMTRVLRVARTIADLQPSPAIELPHLTEAMQFRATTGAAMGQ
jgi:magnesium chelatase family protein